MMTAERVNRLALVEIHIDMHSHTNGKAIRGNLGFSNLPEDTLTCGLEKLEIELSIFWLENDLLYLLSRNHPEDVSVPLTADKCETRLRHSDCLSNCVRYKVTQMKILCKSYVTSHKLKTMSHNVADVCWHDFGVTGSCMHRRWHCPEVRRFWTRCALTIVLVNHGWEQRHLRFPGNQQGLWRCLSRPPFITRLKLSHDKN